MARLPASRLRGLEDRYVDLLIPGGNPALVAQTARAWVDLNRSERDVDRAMVRGGHALHAVASAKVRGGLGVVPRRLARDGDIWRGPISAAHFNERIERHHRPFHEALSALLHRTLARFGIAVLIDLHSMPPLPEVDAPQYVVGDLFGRSAQSRFAQVAREVLGAGGEPVGLNSPYAGGHILERHSRPHRGIHALQIEVDRSLYLDAGLDQPGQGLTLCRARILALTVALGDEALGSKLPLAAE